MKLLSLCPGRDSNSHGSCLPWDFKSHVSTSFTTRAGVPNLLQSHDLARYHRSPNPTVGQRIGTTRGQQSPRAPTLPRKARSHNVIGARPILRPLVTAESRSPHAAVEPIPMTAGRCWTESKLESTLAKRSIPSRFIVLPRGSPPGPRRHPDAPPKDARPTTRPPDPRPIGSTSFRSGVDRILVESPFKTMP